MVVKAHALVTTVYHISAVPMLQAARRALLRYLSEVKRATTPRPYDFREELMLWDFTEDVALTRWDCICDEDVHGQSTAALEPNGKGKGRYTPSPLVCSVMQ